MGIEGGGRFESFDTRRSPEDPFRRGLEARENYWLANMGVTPETLERIRESLAHEGSSTEYLVYMLLLSKLVEQGAEWDPQRRARVRNLVGVLRVVGLPNMNGREQASLKELSQATTFNMRAIQYNITPDIVLDIGWIWNIFGLQVPQQAAGQGILEAPPTSYLKGET